ncbi:MAG: hypothetical protein LW833_15530 [Hyphomicrobiales bacterium]|nr:hypothetical protein [Rhodobacter sp.]MCE2934343.1 hypothetical protein [Hyphomicrobiales bacterium]
MNTILTAAQINRLAQRLSDKPLGRSASATTAAERLQRLLAVRIGTERAAASAKVILGAPGFETAVGRLVAEIECDDDEADVGTLAAASAVANAPALVSEIATKTPLQPEPAAPPRRRKDADVEARARQGELPPPPDFSAATHDRFRAKLEGLVALAEKGDIDGLRAVVINPVSSSPKAMARYRDLAVMAIEVREGRA